MITGSATNISNRHLPNVVAFYGIVPDGPGGTLATVTEYMVNGSLKQVLQKKDRYRSGTHSFNCLIFHAHSHCQIEGKIINFLHDKMLT